MLIIFGDDRALVHSISIKDLSASDIRMVDDSLFSLPNVLGIFSRPSALHLGASRSPLLAASEKHTPIQAAGKSPPIYLCFPTGQKMRKWRGLLRTFAKPEVYGPAQRGGTHRCHRQIDLKVLEAKMADRRRLVASTSTGAVGTTLDDDDAADTSASALGLGNPAEALTKQIGVEKSVTGQTSRNIEDEDDEDSDVGMTSGPISGLPGRQRILENNNLIVAPTSYEMEKKASDTPSTTTPTCYCLIWMASVLVAQTKMCNSSFKSMTWFDKFSLKDLPSLTSLQIDIMHSGRNGKSGVLGTVNLPVETMRRGEPLEGWFPIWASRAREADTASTPAVEGCYSDEVVGEIKIAINVTEETILPVKRYTSVEEALCTNDYLGLVTLLCRHLEEDRIMSHLVDIYASKGAIVEHLKELMEAESASLGDNPALLFRSNTLLTRAIDKFQRLYCRDWLDGCIGSTVRRVCREQICLEANDSSHYYLSPLAVHDSSSLPNTTVTVESNLDALLRLCKDLWTTIYANRHRCPPDLRRVLFHIRTKVNSHFAQSDLHNGHGIQGVGAFVFLRLICPAITTPHLYGIMGSSPSGPTSKTLMLIAKVFLALANKKASFDKDKEPWLLQANGFLADQGSIYDDFITFISTEPSNTETVLESLGDDVDYDFQRSIKMLTKTLPTLHRESLPSQEYMLDRPLALAEMVSYVVKEASIDMPTESQHRNGDKDGLDRFRAFVDLCCDIEDKTGIYLERAGCDPEPIDFARYSNGDSLGVTTTNRISPLSNAHASSAHMRARRATVTGVRAQSSVHVTSKPVISVDETSRPQPRLPMIFGPHLKSTNTSGRASMDGEEEGKRPSLSRIGRGSSIEEARLVGRRGGELMDLIADVESPSTLRSKVKRSWWKRL